jgi:hypothetical protein
MASGGYEIMLGRPATPHSNQDAVGGSRATARPSHPLAGRRVWGSSLRGSHDVGARR